MSKAAIIGWILMLSGTAIWFYGYAVTGHPPFIDWRAYTPWWISDFLPNRESEIGMVLIFVGMVPAYWPTQR